MKPYIENRVLEVAKYILGTKATIRKTARVFMVSKSTIHKDVSVRLQQLNPQLATQVNKVIDYNKEERHIRGGESTKRKYLNM